jgi:hypothetical protein
MSAMASLAGSLRRLSLRLIPYHLNGRLVPKESLQGLAMPLPWGFVPNESVEDTVYRAREQARARRGEPRNEQEAQELRRLYGEAQGCGNSLGLFSMLEPDVREGAAQVRRRMIKDSLPPYVGTQWHCRHGMVSVCETRCAARLAFTGVVSVGMPLCPGPVCVGDVISYGLSLSEPARYHGGWRAA